MKAPTPYSGKEKYIFISYSHRDTNKAFAIISKLINSGYRVWFDGGIDPGTEWDENIAYHINECGYFIALMSKNYLESNNCKDELNYARDLEKERLIVYLEDVELPSGMAMRINRLQSIFQYKYEREEDFYEKLFTTKNIEVCRLAGGAEPKPYKTEKPVQPSKPQVQTTDFWGKHGAKILCIIATFVVAVSCFSNDYKVVIPLLVGSFALVTWSVYIATKGVWRILASVLYFLISFAISCCVQDAQSHDVEGIYIIAGIVLSVVIHFAVCVLRNKRK